jgi:hypothetical protein
MRWDDVVLAHLAAVKADPTILSIVGLDAILADGDRNLTVPSLVYKVISDVNGENFEDVRIQWTLFTRSVATLIDGEAALRRLFHHELPATIGGLNMYSLYQDDRADVEGLADGIRGSSQSFTSSPVRSRYVFA